MVAPAAARKTAASLLSQESAAMPSPSPSPPLSLEGRPNRRVVLSCLALTALSAAAAVNPASAWAAHPPLLSGAITRPSLMLARDASPDIDPAGWLVSEKLDGVRAWWDGRTLRFRSGRVLPAPAWFTARLPAQALDGELWLGHGRFDEVSGLLRRSRAEAVVDSDWQPIRYALFDLPGAPGPFADRAERLHELTRRLAWPACQALRQERLASRAALQRRLQQVLDTGGEGLMLHHADALWQPGRSSALLKLKPLHDAEALVVGHQPGRGRHVGRLGALRVRTADGVEFELGTGFSDAQREQPPARGTIVTYSYRGLSPSGVPRFASFLRVRER
jgi:DNA ligase 1